MSHPAKPRMSGPKKDLMSLLWAKSQLALGFRREFGQAADLVARGQIEVSDAIVMIRAGTAKTAADRARQREQEHRRRVKILAGIEGIGDTLAERLVNEFGSLEAIVAATPDQLKVVKGIGKKRAGTIADETRRSMR